MPTAYTAKNPNQPHLVREKFEISDSADAAKLLNWMRTETQEHFVVVSLNVKLEVIKVDVVHKGGRSESIVCPACVFRSAIECGSSFIIVAHNHPSGTTDPSPEDLAITKRLAQAADILNMEVLDHLILGDGWNSLKRTYPSCLSAS